MMRSLFSGISGLKVHQTKMDVIGNNISNVNTAGFRSSSVNFTDVFYQTTQSATGPNAETRAAGTNAKQIGLGANVAAIAVDLSGSGSTQRTDRGMDIMINGDAFFIVRTNDGSTRFTKSGALDIDANGTLYCTTNGASVLGWQIDGNGDIRRDTVDTLTLMGGENLYSDPSATTDVTLTGNVDRKDSQVKPEAYGYPVSVNFYDNVGNLYMAKLSIQQNAAGSGDGDDTGEVDEGTYSIKITDIFGPDGKSALKKHQVDEAGEETEKWTLTALAKSNFTFGGKTIALADENIDENTGEITFSEPDGGWPQLNFNIATGAFSSITGLATETEEGQPAETKINLNLSGVDAEGNLADGATANTFPISGVNIDFSSLTLFASGGNCSVKPTRGDKIDGSGAGNMTGKLDGFSVQTDGKIYGNYSNGESKLLGQIAVATFANPSGLESVGNSLFAQTMNSGEFDGVGSDISDIGSFTVGALEMSDVDLSTEFTNLITTQRGFQANSRIITTSDSMLEELVNLKR